MSSWKPSMPAASSLIAYLRSRGWSLQGANERWSTFSIATAEGDVVVEVPLLSEAGDLSRRISEVLQNLAWVEKRSDHEVWADIVTADRDVVRFALEAPAMAQGRIPVDAASEVYAGVRDAVLAAACAALDKRPVYGQRKPDAAMTFLREATFGQTEIGSYVLKVEVPVGPLLTPDLVDPTADPSPPFERQVFTTLANALSAAHSALPESLSAASLEPFERQVASGVSANLCDAIGRIVRATDAERLRVAFSFAAWRPAPASVPRALSFSRDEARGLADIASSWREKAPTPEHELIGMVRRLEGSVERGGEVGIAVAVDGKERVVRVQLGAADYARAVDAHRDGGLVRCVGDLTRSSRMTSLANPRDFKVLEKE